MKTIIISLMFFAFCGSIVAQTTTDYYPTENRNVIAIGYQIGGWSMLGFEYEVRIHDYIGINLGGGFIGYTGGLKFHFNADKHSPFINFSYKDGGGGQISTLGIEGGGMYIFPNSKKGLGLYGQAGIASILRISDEMEERLYKGEEAPPATLTIGVGLCW